LKLIVGLGNPGSRYRFSRHNFGFLALDELAFRHNIVVKKERFGALVGDGNIGSIKVILAKPQSYMNLSGLAVKNLSDYKRIDTDDMIVIHDDLDLLLGTIRLKLGGGHGGHKGLVSVMENMGNPDFIRVRLGIGKPDNKEKTEGYVLEFFSATEMERVRKVMAEAAKTIEEILVLGLQSAMGRRHSKLQINNEEV